MTALRKTPLHQVHVDLGARMVEFAGWHMPIQYAGLIEEHQSVRTGAGVFDVSHMGEFTIAGVDSFEFLQFALTNNAAKVRRGRAQYTLMCSESGGVIDDAVLYRPDNYVLVVNAANVEADWEWLSSLAAGFDVQITNRSEDYALLAAQGPKAETLLDPLCDIDLSRLRRWRIRAAVLDGRGVLIARTGYTGEDGFEIFMASYDAVRVWGALTTAGFAPVGLGARNTLRLEAGMPLHGQDISTEINSLEAGLSGVVDVNKGDFVGRKALLEAAETGLSRVLRGLKMLDRAIPREHCAVRTAAGAGIVTSGTYSPTLKVGIAMALLPPSVKTGDPVSVEIRGRERAAVVVELPFYSRFSKSSAGGS